jgi:hypothetical protein
MMEFLSFSVLVNGISFELLSSSCGLLVPAAVCHCFLDK